MQDNGVHAPISFLGQECTYESFSPNFYRIQFFRRPWFFFVICELSMGINGKIQFQKVKTYIIYMLGVSDTCYGGFFRDIKI